MKINNPLFMADMPDPDVLRVGDAFYLVSTTMFYMPAVPILKSNDLQHWHIVSYVCSQIEDNDTYHLRNDRHAYGKGQWATSLMQYKGRFYACFVCHDMGNTYLFSTDDIEKSDWDRVELPAVYHDMSFLCFEDKVYLVYGNGDIRIVELKEDFSGTVEGSDRLLFTAPKEGIRLRCEGCRAYVRDGEIYLLFIEWPVDTPEKRGIRREVCYRLQDLSGAYERRIILEDDGEITGCGIAQGPLFDDAEGNWYAMLFQDCGAVGRIPFLMPVAWKDGWPVPGIDGKAPKDFEVPLAEKIIEDVIQSDSFNHRENRLSRVWQWNHAPNNEAWSFTKRPGFLRLESRGLVQELFEAENTLTQRTRAPYSAFTVKLSCGGMKDGDYAGLCVMLEKYGQIGVRQRNGVKELVLRCRDGERAPYDVVCREGILGLKSWYSIKEQTVSLSEDTVWLKVAFDFGDWGKGEEQALFSYSLDGKNYRSMGEGLSMFFSLSLFVGARIGIFSYNEENEVGGYTDFCDFTYSSQR
ncbi:MAG: glycoside hydrolase 43 family protein [Lachnospiraceae bacterium]|nr:glycoside hydrolase 43 family protein [Lachnospiraceae bacterium]